MLIVKITFGRKVVSYAIPMLRNYTGAIKGAVSYKLFSLFYILQLEQNLYGTKYGSHKNKNVTKKNCFLLEKLHCFKNNPAMIMLLQMWHGS